MGCSSQSSAVSYAGDGCTRRLVQDADFRLKCDGASGKTVAVKMIAMTTTRILTSAAFLAALAVAAPAHAGQHRGGGGHGGGSHAAGASHGSGGGGGAAAPSSGGHAASTYRGGVVRGTAVPGRPGSVGPRVSGGVVLYQPYYTFRPRLSLGFGLWAGYPFAYPYSLFGYPYYYAAPYPVDPYAYGYAAPSYGYPAQPYAPYPPSSAYPPANDPSRDSAPGPTVGVQRGGDQTAPGAISFEITPDTAAVFVDGTYVGTAGNFGPTSQPLGLVSGRHHIEIRASGYRTMTFDADVTPGQVIPYQGTLQPN
jgi:hypothetical protein